MKYFGYIPEQFAGYEKANILLQSIPYDGTSTCRKGADKGFDAFLEAAANMELYDIDRPNPQQKKDNPLHALHQKHAESFMDALTGPAYSVKKKILNSNFKKSYILHMTQKILK